MATTDRIFTFAPDEDETDVADEGLVSVWLRF